MAHEAHRTAAHRGPGGCSLPGWGDHHHEEAARAHHEAANHHEAGNHEEAHEHSTNAHEHSERAHQHSAQAHKASQEVAQ